MSDTFEAVVGAIFLDQGFNEARSFLYKYLFPSDFKSFIEAYKVDEKIAYGIDFIYDPTKLTYKFKNKSLIDTFFTIIDEKPLLKYIGISLLRFLAVEHVFSMFPTASESQMTLSHHAIINQHEVCVIEAINKLDLNSCKDPRQDSTVCFHAFLGAVYLDNDANMETFFVDNTRRHDLKGLVHPNVMSIFNVTQRLQPHMIQKPQKTILQHLCQVKCGSIPVYQTTEVEQGWRVSILLDEKIIAEAIHKDSRQATEQAVLNGIALYSK
jgi:dsRNA-specific ribonuclease